MGIRSAAWANEEMNRALRASRRNGVRMEDLVSGCGANILSFLVVDSGRNCIEVMLREKVFGLIQIKQI